MAQAHPPPLSPLILDNLVDRLHGRGARPRAARSWRCPCGAQIYFDNSRCLSCGGELGYDPQSGLLLRLPVDAMDGTALLRCANHHQVDCNWLLPASEATAQGGWCKACRLNRTVPDLSRPGNAQAWVTIEAAKRRLVSQLLGLGLPVQSRRSEDRRAGLMFDFLQPTDGEPLHTGHLNGLITLNVEEADDVHREAIRKALHEPYRTLLGHLRHEVGHYYWDRLIAYTGWLNAFRFRFGDEQQDYAEALARYYEFGPSPGWDQHYISAYASAHPWEDWAETFAHYLHMIDAMDTALSYGWVAEQLTSGAKPFTESMLDVPADASRFLDLVNSWAALTVVLNELARSMGQRDIYPFVINGAVVAKLHLVHRVVSGV